jgi:ubiquinone/menaquinone biosynthesis C-methylase UbiE
MLSEIKKIVEKYQPFLGENNFEFMKRVYETDAYIYESRLKSIGLNGKKKVLDAGCGFGQWSLILAQINKEVFSLDKQAERVILLNEIISELKISNINVTKGILSHLPYENNSFDAIFCYGAIFCTDWKKTLKEFSRVLEPGGTLYFNANEIGWYVNLWNSEPNKTNDYLPKEISAQSLLNTVNYHKHGIPPEKGQILITKEECIHELCKLGFMEPLILGEGKINISKDDVMPTVFFDETYDGLAGCYEVLVSKELS